MTATMLTDQIKRAIGYETAPLVVECDKTFVERFIIAIEESNVDAQGGEIPLPSQLEGPAVPRSLPFAFYFFGRSPFEPIAALLPSRALDGGGEWEFFAPIRLGDRITVVNKLAEAVERQGNTGPMLILTHESTWHDQEGALVARARLSAIYL